MQTLKQRQSQDRHVISEVK